MSQKNETTVLVLALAITAALLAGGFWWFSRSSGFNLSTENFLHLHLSPFRRL